MQEVTSWSGPAVGRILLHSDDPRGYSRSNPLAMVEMLWYWKSPIPRWISGFCAAMTSRTRAALDAAHAASPWQSV